MTKAASGDSKSTLYCSFCGKSQHEVRKLIAGPTVFICDECVELCMDIIREEHKIAFVKSKDGVPTPREIREVLEEEAKEFATALTSKSGAGPRERPLDRPLRGMIEWRFGDRQTSVSLAVHILCV